MNAVVSNGCEESEMGWDDFHVGEKGKEKEKGEMKTGFFLKGWDWIGR